MNKILTLVNIMLFSLFQQVVSSASMIANPTNDVAFKHLMALQGGQDIVKSILNSFIPDFAKNPVKSVAAGSTAVPALNTAGKKQTFMDFHVTTQSGEHVVVEMQVRRHNMFDERALYYAAYTFSHQLDGKQLQEKHWYKNIKTTYSLQFLGYGEKSDDKSNFIKHYMMTDKNSGQTIDAMQMIQIELPKAIKHIKIPTNQSEQLSDQDWWILLFKEPTTFTEEFETQMRNQNTSIPEIVIQGMNRLNRAKWNPDLKQAYNSNEVDREGYSEEFKRERKEGINKGILITLISFAKFTEITDDILTNSGLAKVSLDVVKKYCDSQKLVETKTKQFITLLKNKYLLTQ